ncbi:putative DUF3971 domain-containing protein [uncultured Gammaproteobacteria bacterium]
MIRRTLSHLLRLVGGLFSGAVVLIGLLTWRLTLGPIDLAPLTPYLERLLSDAGNGRIAVGIGGVSLSWESGEGADGGPVPGLRALRVLVTDADGQALAAIPELGISLSLPALVRGRLAPTRLVVIRPHLRVERTRSGGYAWTMEAMPLPVLMPPPPSVPDVVPEPFEPTAVLSVLLAPFAPFAPLAALVKVAVTGAEVVVADQISGVTVTVSRADMMLSRDRAGLNAHLRLDVATGDGGPPVKMSADARRNATEHATHLRLTLDSLRPSAMVPLAPLLPELAALTGVTTPISAALDLTLDGNDHPGPISLSLRATPGVVWPAADRTNSIRLETGALEAQITPGTTTTTGGTTTGGAAPGTRVEISWLALTLAHPALAITGSAAFTVNSGDGGQGLLIGGRGGLRLDHKGRSTSLEIEAAPAPVSGPAGDEAGSVIGVRLAGFDPAVYADLAPMLAPLAGTPLPINGRLEATLNRDLIPQRLTVDLTAGPGSMTVPGLYPTAVPVAAITLKAKIEGPLTPTPSPPPRAPPKPTHVADPVGHCAQRSQVTAGHLGPAIARVVNSGISVAGTPAVSSAAGTPAVSSVAGTPAVPSAAGTPAVSSAAGVPAIASVLPAKVVLDRFSIDFGGPRLALSGSAERRGEGGGFWDIRAKAEGAAVPLDDLARLWPEPVGTNAREWIVENLSEGMIDRAWATVSAKAPAGDPGEIEPEAIDGGLTLRNATVRYLKPLPVVQGISGNMVADGRSLLIHTHGGGLGELRLGDGTVAITKLNTPQECIDIDMPVTGPVRAALTLIDLPPLGYAKKFDLDPVRVDGTANTRVRFYFPLFKDLTTDEIEVGVTSIAKGLTVREAVAGHTVTEGAINLELDVKGMIITGKVKLAGVPLTVEWKEFFKDDAPLRTRISARGDVTDADLARVGLPNAPWLTGTAGTDSVVTTDRRRRTTLATTLNLARTTLALPEIGWSKPMGGAGSGRFSVEFDKGRAVRVPEFSVEAGGLTSRGALELIGSGQDLKIARARITTLRAGPNDFQADFLARDGGGWSMTFHGASLDGRAMLHPPDKATREREAAERAERGEGERRSPPLEMSIQVGKLVTAPDGKGLHQVLAKLRRDGNGWERAEINARLGEGTGTVTVALRPDGGKRRLEASCDDAGLLLKLLDWSEGVRGGRLHLTGEGDTADPKRTLTGRVEMSEFTVIKAPVLARLLNAMSLAGLIELLQGEGLVFSRLDGGYRWSGDTLVFNNLRTAGGALGLTLQGRLDLGRDNAELEGTVVPIYSVNRILGLIPLLGDLISGGEGNGLFAATWSMSGPLSEPSISVNPLSMLAPGFLRNLFFLGGGG